MLDDDYLWDKSGEPDPEVVDLERALSTLASRPRELGVVARSRRPVVVPALISAAAALAIGLGVGYRFGSARTEVVTAIATESVPAAALASEEPRRPIVPPDPSLSASAPASARTAEKPDDDPLAVDSAPLTSQQIQRVVSRYTGAIRRSCWQPALINARDGALPRARIDVSIVVAPSGRVDSVNASPDPTDYPGLSSCIVRAVRGWRFPAAGGKTHVTIPFVFAAA